MNARSTPQALAIRHVHFEDLGTLEPLLQERGLELTYVEAGSDWLEQVDPLAPALLVVLGGPIAAYDEPLYPFLTQEIRLVERRLAAGLPTLGICLGAQVMARALGARVYGGRKEIGWSSLSLSAEGDRSCLHALAGTPVLHWHGDTFDLPDGAVHLASTPACENQAYAWGRNALALQFHAEVEPWRLERWYIGHACELAGTPGVSVPHLRQAAGECGQRLVASARRMFEAWLVEVALDRRASMGA